MKKNIIFIAVIFYSFTLFSQGNSDVLWDFGLKTGVKWHNGKSTYISHDNKAIGTNIHTHFSHPSLGLAFTFYPRLASIDLGFETMFGHNQFGNTIETDKNSIFDASDYSKDALFIKENVKYVFSFGRSSVEYVFQPYIGLGFAYIFTNKEFYSLNIDLNQIDESKFLSDYYHQGSLPMHTVKNDYTNVAFNATAGLDFEVRTNSLGLLFGFGYDLGINSFSEQTFRYKYHNDVAPKEVVLKTRNAGLFFNVGIKYLFR